MRLRQQLDDDGRGLRPNLLPVAALEFRKLVRFSLAFILVVAAAGKLLGVQDVARWLTGLAPSLVTLRAATWMAISFSMVELLSAAALLFSDTRLHVDVAVFCLVSFGAGLVITLWVQPGECACYGAFTFMNNSAVRTPLAIVGMLLATRLVLRGTRLHGGTAASLSLVFFLCIPTFVEAKDPETLSREGVVGAIRGVEAEALKSHVKMGVATWIRGSEEPFMLQTFDAHLDAPCERWTQALRNQRVESKRDSASWIQAIQRLSEDATDSDIWSWVDEASSPSVIIYDGGRMLTAAGNREGWWTERRLVRYDTIGQGPALYGWCKGPRGAPFHELLESLGTWVGGNDESGEAHLFVGAPAGSLKAPVSSEVLKRRPMFCVRLYFEKGDRTLPRRVVMTKLPTEAAVQAMAVDLASPNREIVATPGDYEAPALDLEVVGSVARGDVRLPTETRVKKRKGQREHIVFTWADSHQVCGTDFFNTSKRLPETMNAPVYFRIDELTGETSISKDGEPLHPWDPLEDGGSAPAEESSWQLAAALALALLLLSVFCWRRMRALRRAQE